MNLKRIFSAINKIDGTSHLFVDRCLGWIQNETSESFIFFFWFSNREDGLPSEETSKDNDSYLYVGFEYFDCRLFDSEINVFITKLIDKKAILVIEADKSGTWYVRFKVKEPTGKSIDDIRNIRDYDCSLLSIQKNKYLEKFISTWNSPNLDRKYELTLAIKTI